MTNKYTQLLTHPIKSSLQSVGFDIFLSPRENVISFPVYMSDAPKINLSDMSDEAFEQLISGLTQLRDHYATMSKIENTIQSVIKSEPVYPELTYQFDENWNLIEPSNLTITLLSDGYRIIVNGTHIQFQSDDHPSQKDWSFEMDTFDATQLKKRFERFIKDTNYVVYRP